MPSAALSIARELCLRFEGIYLHPYLCPAGIPTVGVGATYYQDGTRVTLADPPITRQQAMDLLVWMIRTKYLPEVLRLCPGITDPRRLAAIIDFTYNLGAGQLRGSNLRRRINAEDWTVVPAELRKWNKGGGRVLRGLVIRREAEAALL